MAPPSEGKKEEQKQKFSTFLSMSVEVKEEKEEMAVMTEEANILSSLFPNYTFFQICFCYSDSIFNKHYMPGILLCVNIL